MTKIIKKTSIVLLTSLLVISNMVSRFESFANENNILEASTFTVKKQENPNCKPEKVTNLRITDKSTTCLKLEWDKVSQIIHDIFGGTEIEILVCKKE